MLKWLFRYKKTEEAPHYSALKATPTRGLPPEVRENEESQSFKARRDAIEQTLLDPDQRPPIEAPLFTELLAEERGVVTITLPNDGAQCVPVFSTPFRAADYARTLLNQGPRAQYLSSSPLQFVRMLRDLEDLGIGRFTLDCCPRCLILNIIDSRSIKVPDDAVRIWAIIKSGELARAELYITQAFESARTGFLELARDTANRLIVYSVDHGIRQQYPSCRNLTIGRASSAPINPHSLLLAKRRRFSTIAGSQGVDGSLAMIQSQSSSE